ncbi:CHASE4 domain-containing protein [Leptolyngbya sp. FACHB-261]|uniref:CHASE4 domain-containing protein n=1 Tax=Leptolyngbya sp. FACHB-261 TaxID=2692806 RepID=UPI0016874ACD|nr:CHASE4 domain-containing protein [Leptolyngbya sp. FACHB-261]MBD2102420.1 PAS domain S-box protein [Leptolyngbya sp. FACHB-261]
MSLRKKTLRILGVVLLSLNILVYAISSNVLLENSAELERQSVHQDVERVLDALDRELADLSKVARDWAWWDDTYQFIEDGNPEYIQSNINDTTFTSLKLNLLILFKSSGQLALAESFDLEQKKEIPVPAQLQTLPNRDLLLQNVDTESSHSGIVLLPQGPILIASEPILTSNNQGPSRGTLLMGAYLDANKVKQLAELTHIPINLQPASSADIPAELGREPRQILVRALNTDAIVGYTLLPDIYGRPALLLRVDIPRAIYHQALNSVYYLLLSLLTVGLVLGTIILLILDKLVLSRLARLNTGVSKVRASGDLSLRVPLAGDDELANLGRTINGMLETVAFSQSELQTSEKKYRSVVNNVKEVIFQTDAIGLWTFLNPAWTVITGFTHSESIGTHFLTYIDAEDRQTSLELFQALVERQKTEYQREIRFLTKAGSSRWIEVYARLMLDPDGRVMGTSGTLNDITERRQTAEALLRARLAEAANQALEKEIAERQRAEAERAELLAQAEAANRLKDEFLSILSHEIRTPLNGILGWAQLLRRGRMEPVKATRALETIERNAKMQAQLIDDLLDVSRIIRGKLSLEVQPLSLVSVVDAVLETLHPAIDAKGIQIEAKLDPAASSVLGDANRLQQVVWNLLTNAVKFTPQGGQVEVRLERVNGSAQIQVQDTGQGIKAEFLPYVFERFRQADSTTTRAQGGLGLGLAIVRHLVELHGGTVQADSAGEGQGATFTVKLPLRAKDSQESEAKQSLPSVWANAVFPGLRVLVVDDETDARELLTFVLEEAGAEVTAVDSTPEALAVLDRWSPSILLSDIGMPGEDGYALIRQIRSRSAAAGGQIPAAALTAYASEEDRTRVLAAGFQFYLTKPIDPVELKETVARLARQILRPL